MPKARATTTAAPARAADPPKLAPTPTDVFRALSSARRREILRLVRRGERTAGEIAANFGVTRPAVSQDLQALAKSGLLRARRDATRRLYAIRPEGLRVVEQFLNEFWSDRLQMLKEAAEAGAPRRDGAARSASSMGWGTTHRRRTR